MTLSLSALIFDSDQESIREEDYQESSSIFFHDLYFIQSSFWAQFLMAGLVKWTKPNSLISLDKLGYYNGWVDKYIKNFLLESAYLRCIGCTIVCSVGNLI